MLAYFKKSSIKSIYDFIDIINSENYNKLLIKPSIESTNKDREISIFYRALGDEVLDFKEFYRTNIDYFQIGDFLKKNNQKIIPVEDFTSLRIIPTLFSRIETLENKILTPIEVDLSNCRHLNDFNLRAKTIDEVKETLNHFSKRNVLKSFV